MFAIAAALLGLIVLLATLQYRWLGRISDAERDSRQSILSARTAAFASEFDKELTLAYMLFQVEPVLDLPGTDVSLATRVAGRYERWQSTARHPRLLKEVYIATRVEDTQVRLQRFDPAARTLKAARWPGNAEELRRRLAGGAETSRVTPSSPRGGTFFVRTLASTLWEEVPALVVPTPMVFFNAPLAPGSLPVTPEVAYAVLVLDRDYVTREMLPALAQQHFQGIGDDVEYEVAVVRTSDGGVLYRSTSGFSPNPDAKVDATAELFQVRTQEFAQMAADVRRFIAASHPEGSTIATFLRSGEAANDASPAQMRNRVIVRETRSPAGAGDRHALGDRAIVTTAIAKSGASDTKWRLLVKHPAGSLEAAVNSTRRRNLLISSSILAVLAASVALLVLSARRAQETARQQMEFVAAVSHELRTPLAVIRSAGDNLAHGVVGDADRIRKYGELVRGEGRRLSEMVEQILEFAGIQSGQRRLDRRPVAVSALLAEVLAASAALIDAAGIKVDVDLPGDLPPLAGDEAALRRVFQNLIGNAIKYGGEGGWLGLTARASGAEVRITVADHGIGIVPAEQPRIFEPFYRAADVIAARIQGAGLGLSLVHRIVEAHGGRITVKSVPGAGSEFTVHLQAAGPEPVAGADPRTAEAPRFT
jgi:two-component system sensor histidine kinase SenX3